MILEHFFNLMQCISADSLKKKCNVSVQCNHYTRSLQQCKCVTVFLFYFIFCLLTENKYTLFMGKISELYRKENCFT